MLPKGGEMYRSVPNGEIEKGTKVSNSVDNSSKIGSLNERMSFYESLEIFLKTKTLIFIR